jgi:iron uptake system component EfeO
MRPLAASLLEPPMSAPARPRVSAAVVAATAAVTAVSGCAQKADAEGGGPGAVGVTATDTGCAVSRKSFPAGHVRITVENKGTKVTEVYVYTATDQIVTERENIGPGTKATITTQVKAGTYQIACKPGMEGEGIRQRVTATGSGAVASDPRLDRAVAAYREYVREQAALTVPAAKKFAAAVGRGDIETAKNLFAPSRVGWERTEPVAESFGDIDPKVDIREDGLEQRPADGEDVAKGWTGWHRLERSLWKDKRITARDKELADKLVTDLTDWQKRVGTAEITPTSMANGAKELLDEVATGKITGEEDRYSHTDLSDFNANVEGAEKAFQLLRPVAAENTPELVKELDRRFAALGAQLDEYRGGGGFVSYETVSEARRKQLSDGVNALAEPLSRLAAAVVAR